MKEKIGIIGSGIVAKTLGAGFTKHGYEVMLGSRNSSKLSEWQAGEGAGALLGNFQETAAFGDILVLAVKGTAAKDALALAGADHLEGKTIMDAANPIAEEAPVNGILRFFTEQNDSLMEQLQTAFPAANFVKAYNSVGSAQMVDPDFETKPTMFICGNSVEAKAQVSAIIKLFGWEPMDMGAVEAARAIEPLCMLWCIPGFLNNEWSHAFKLLKH
ncbi:MAG: NAD(P)-binding domain-containing protein [Bacteroidota bacterium]